MSGEGRGSYALKTDKRGNALRGGGSLTPQVAAITTTISYFSGVGRSSSAITLRWVGEYVSALH